MKKFKNVKLGIATLVLSVVLFGLDYFGIIQLGDSTQVPVTTEAAAETTTAAETTRAAEKTTAAETTTAAEKTTAAETTRAAEKTTAAETKAQKSYVFASKKLLNEHYEKHGIEMGFASAADYEAAASAVINDPRALYKTEAEDGDGIYYIEETNEFVVLSTKGKIRTYFLPSAGKDYFDRQ